MLIGELYQLFCKREKSRYNLDAPFYQDGWWIATDSRVLIRRKSDAQDSEGNHPKCGVVIDRIGSVAEWNPWPEIAMCEGCVQDGYRIVECGNCGGDGKCNQCRCENEHDCGECHGEGTVTDICECRTTRIDIGGKPIASYYVWLIGQLGGVEFGVVPNYDNVFFRWPEGEGVVAAMKKED